MVRTFAAEAGDLSLEYKPLVKVNLPRENCLSFHLCCNFGHVTRGPSSKPLLITAKQFLNRELYRPPVTCSELVPLPRNS